MRRRSRGDWHLDPEQDAHDGPEGGREVRDLAAGEFLRRERERAVYDRAEFQRARDLLRRKVGGLSSRRSTASARRPGSAGSSARSEATGVGFCAAMVTCRCERLGRVHGHLSALRPVISSVARRTESLDKSVPTRLSAARTCRRHRRPQGGKPAREGSAGRPSDVHPAEAPSVGSRSSCAPPASWPSIARRARPSRAAASRRNATASFDRPTSHKAFLQIVANSYTGVAYNGSAVTARTAARQRQGVRQANVRAEQTDRPEGLPLTGFARCASRAMPWSTKAVRTATTAAARGRR